MNEEHRPDPEALLRKIQQEEQVEKEKSAPNGHKKGRLKIFLGYCAGVGKTYRMLQEAGECSKNNVSTVIGVVETHGRKETEALLEGLEIIPKKKIEYKGMFLEEMDLDSILEHHPKLAIVDELAHTNAPGSRHNKRYQGC